jgi:hypothetical protein
VVLALTPEELDLLAPSALPPSTVWLKPLVVRSFGT